MRKPLHPIGAVRSLTYSGRANRAVQIKLRFNIRNICGCASKRLAPDTSCFLLVIYTEDMNEIHRDLHLDQAAF